MGAEYYYRQQERLVDDALRALRQLRAGLYAGKYAGKTEPELRK